MARSKKTAHTPVAEMTAAQMVAEANQLQSERVLTAKSFKTKALLAAHLESLRPRVAPRRDDGPTIRQVAEGLLLQPIPYGGVLVAIRAQFPMAHTTDKCLRWYATQMRKAGKVLPERPRPTRAAAPSADAV